MARRTGEGGYSDPSRLALISEDGGDSYSALTLGSRKVSDRIIAIACAASSLESTHVVEVIDRALGCITVKPPMPSDIAKSFARSVAEQLGATGVECIAVPRKDLYDQPLDVIRVT